MGGYIVEHGTGRGAKVVTARELNEDYEVVDSNPNGLSIIKDSDGEFWVQIPQDNDSYQLFPAVKSVFPVL